MTQFHRRPLLFSLGLGIILLFGLSACSGGSSGGGPQKSPAVRMALNSPRDFPNKDASLKNDDGVGHLVQEHWDTSTQFFRDAIAMSPKLAEAHFNLALALDQMGSHEEAAEHFRTAKELAPTNPKIAENEILKKHL